jgi:hypothetical protein
MPMIEPLLPRYQSPLSGTGHTFLSGVYDRAPFMVWHNLMETTKESVIIVYQAMRMCQSLHSNFALFPHFLI